MALQPSAGHGLLILDEISRSHTTTHHSRQDSSGRVISPSLRPLPDKTQHSQQKNIHAPGGIRTHNLRSRAAADPRLRQRGHWDRQVFLTATRLCLKTLLSLRLLPNPAFQPIINSYRHAVGALERRINQCSGEGTTETAYCQLYLVFSVTDTPPELLAHSSIIRGMLNEHIRGHSYMVTSFPPTTNTKKANLYMTVVVGLYTSLR